MYYIKYKQKARKYLLKLEPKLHLKIAETISNLSDFNLAIKELDIKKLQWEENLYRLRIGKYRVIFEKQDKKLIILVVDIGSRWDVYK